MAVTARPVSWESRETMAMSASKPMAYTDVVDA
jgi:hypothetical protein